MGRKSVKAELGLYHWQQTSQALRPHIVIARKKWRFSLDRHGPTACLLRILAELEPWQAVDTSAQSRPKPGSPAAPRPAVRIELFSMLVTTFGGTALILSLKFESKL